MTERSIDTGLWHDPDLEDWKPLEKLLFIYLWTNDHCNQAGLYQITPKTISDETNIPREDIPELLNGISSKVQWWPDKNLIWVKNFLQRQSKSPKFLIAVAKCLRKIKDKEIVIGYLGYNNTLTIPTIPDLICSNTDLNCSSSDDEGDSKGGGTLGNFVLVYCTECGNSRHIGKNQTVLIDAGKGIKCRQCKKETKHSLQEPS